MTELRHKRDLRGRSKVGIPKATRTGLSCPSCKGKTVNRDISSEGMWYVEYYVLGTVRVTVKVFDKEGKGLSDKFEGIPCEYWGCGFEQRK